MAERGAAAATTGRSVFAGGIWSALSRIVPQLYTLVVSIVAARYLGPDGMGRQSFIAFVQLSLVLLLGGGIFASLLRYAGELAGRNDPSAIRGLLAWGWRVLVVGAVAGGGILAGAGLLGADPRGAWVLAGVACAMSVMQNVPSAILVGLQRWREATVIGLVTGLVATAATVAVLAAGGGITAMFAVEAVVATLNLAGLGYLAVRRTARLAPAAAMPAQLRHDVTRYAAATSVGVVLALVVARRSEVFFLARFSDDSEIALYSIVFAVTAALLKLPEAIGAALAPAFATLYGAAEHDRIAAGFNRALRLLVVVALPIAAVTAAVGPEFLRLLYGDEYAGTGRVLLVMLIAFPLLPLAETAEALLIGLGRVRAQLLATGAAAVVDIAAAALLVPPHGAVGAAAANVSAQIVLTAGLLAVARGIAGLDLRLSPTARAASAAAAAGLCAWGAVSLFGGITGVILGVAAGAALFVLAVRLVGVLDIDDARWASRTIGRAARVLSGT
jgi:O-antigen/teichoic acid export membrane protein